MATLYSFLTIKPNQPLSVSLFISCGSFYRTTLFWLDLFYHPLYPKYFVTIEPSNIEMCVWLSLKVIKSMIPFLNEKIFWRIRILDKLNVAYFKPTLYFSFHIPEDYILISLSLHLNSNISSLNITPALS